MCTHSWGGLYFVTRVFQGSNSGCQVWWQVSLPTQSSHSAFKSRARGSQGQKYIRDNLFTEAELLVNPFTAPEKCITILRLAFTRANIYSTGWIPLIPNTCNQECFPFQIRFSNICACTHKVFVRRNLNHVSFYGRGLMVKQIQCFGFLAAASKCNL